MEHPSHKENEGYVPLPTTDDLQQPPTYTPPQLPGYSSQKQYEGGYQNQGYLPQGQGYQYQEGPTQGQGYQGIENQGYPPQRSGYIQHLPGSSSQSYDSTGEFRNQPVPGGVPPVVNFYSGLSICAMICFLPVGLIAYIKSSEAKNHYATGDYVGAMELARSAKRFAVGCIVCSSIFITLSLASTVVMVVLEANRAN